MMNSDRTVFNPECSTITDSVHPIPDCSETIVDSMANDSNNDKYSNYIYCTFGNTEYAIHPKLYYEYIAPFIERNIVRGKQKAYDNQENIKVLQILGFDLSKNRKQGTDWVKEKRYNNIIILEPTWYWFSQAELDLGRKVFINRGIEKLGPVINPFAKNKSVLYTNEFAIYNNHIPRPGKNPDKYKYFHRNIAENINRFSGKAVGLNQHSKSSCVMFDLDNHNYSDIESGKKDTDLTLNQLYAELNYPAEAMIEQSVFGGYHTGFLTNDTVKDRDITSFVEYFNKKYNADIEARLTTRIFRIPGHFTYKLGYTIMEEGRVRFQPFNPETAFDDYRSKVLRMDASEYRVDYSIFSSKSKYRQYGGTDSHLYKRNRPDFPIANTSIRPGDKYPLTPGSRDKMMIKMACSMSRSGYSFDDYFDELNYANHGSRDWCSWSYQEKHVAAERAWNKAYEYIGNEWYGSYESADKFYTSVEQIPDLLRPLLKDKRIVAHFSNIKDTSYTKNIKRIMQDTEIVLNEVIGKIFHECRHPREVYAEVHADYKMNLEAGFQFPRNRLQRMKKAYNMASDIKGIERSILSNTTLFKQFKHNKLGYKFKYNKKDTSFCKQFYVKDTSPYTKDANMIAVKIILALRPLLSADCLWEYLISAKHNPDHIMCQFSDCDNDINNIESTPFYLFYSPPDYLYSLFTRIKPLVSDENQVIH